MVIDIPASYSRRSPLRSRGMRSLRELPLRRPEQPAAGDSRVQWERIDIDRYVITADGATCGYVDVIGAVFVALAGTRYDRAVEVHQTLDFAAAVRALAAAD